MHSGRFREESQITTNIAHLSAGRFANIEFPLPPLAEQERIVAEVEQRLSVTAVIEAAVNAGLKRADRLRQAILKRVFEGKLVEQNPEDEPVQALLERIREDHPRIGYEYTKKEAVQVEKQRRGRKPGQMELFE